MLEKHSNILLYKKDFSMNIIIKLPNFIGDSIMTIPAIELLKKEYPNASFTIVCKSSSQDIFRNKGIKKFIIEKNSSNRFKRTLILLSEIRKEKYDLGVLFHNTFLDALIFKLSKIKINIGYNKENRKILLHFWLKVDRSRHYINHYANLINQYLDNKYINLPIMNIYHKESKLLKKNNKPVVGFVLGGENKGSRSYPQDLSLELFKEIKDESYNIVLIGDKQDSHNNTIYQKYLEQEDIKVQNLSGKTNISEFIDIIGSLDLLVTIDSSAMHIAAATTTPFLVLLGKGTSPFDTVYPKVDFGEIIFSGNNKIQDNDLIKAITPNEIKDKINKQIKQKRNLNEE